MLVSLHYIDILSVHATVDELVNDATMDLPHWCRINEVYK